MLLLALTERSFYGLQNWWLSVWSNANASTAVRMQTLLVDLHDGGKRFAHLASAGQSKTQLSPKFVCLLSVLSLLSHTHASHLQDT